MIHELKTWPLLFNDILTGVKVFEIRKADRPFKIADELVLREYDPTNEKYTGREISKTVIYILDSFPGIETGYVIMGLSYGEKNEH